MAEFGKENKVSGVFGGVQFNNNEEQAGNIGTNFGENAGTIRRKGVNSKHSGYKKLTGTKK